MIDGGVDACRNEGMRDAPHAWSDGRNSARRLAPAPTRSDALSYNLSNVEALRGRCSGESAATTPPFGIEPIPVCRISSPQAVKISAKRRVARANRQAEPQSASVAVTVGPRWQRAS